MRTKSRKIEGGEGVGRGEMAAKDTNFLQWRHLTVTWHLNDTLQAVMHMSDACSSDGGYAAQDDTG